MRRVKEAVCEGAAAVRLRGKGRMGKGPYE
eukprot:COSAG01_NODE_10028_length_2271_cov_3.372468_5_plen_29_part_01